MHLVPLVFSLVNIDRCINSNSEPEKCYPTKSTIHLAHLVKGELLLPEKIRATTGGIVTPPIFPKPHYPLAFRRASVCVCLYGFVSALSLAQHHVLASPRKRGGGTAVKVFRLAVQYSDSPAFTILKLFRAVTVGIALHPRHQ